MHRKSGLWLMVAGWPLLILLRVRRHGLDWVEVLTCAAATAYAIPSQRFLNVYAVAAAPYLSRDLQEQVERWRWPAWTSRSGTRAPLASLACVAIGLGEWRSGAQARNRD